VRPALLLLVFLAAASPAAPVYEAVVTKRLPHGRGDFTQGLEIRDGRIYQGTGRYGQSRLQVFDLESGELLRQRALPDHLFGEGITVLGDRIFQLTWRERLGIVYRRADLEPLAEFPIEGEGWGLTNDTERLIYSDGSHRLYFLSPASWRIERSLPVVFRGEPVSNLNELEWTPEHIFANVWGSDWIVMIDEDDGEVVGRIDLRGLLPRKERRTLTGVLNGIAKDPDTGKLWVTGKNWPWIYQIEPRLKSTLE